MIPIGLGIPLVIVLIKLSYVVSNYDIGECPAITCTTPLGDSRLNGRWYQVARTRYDNERGDCNRHFISGDASEFQIQYKQLYRQNVDELHIVLTNTDIDNNTNTFNYQAFDTNGAPAPEFTLFPLQPDIVRIYETNFTDYMIHYSCKQSCTFKEHYVRILSRTKEMEPQLLAVLLEDIRVNLGIEKYNMYFPNQSDRRCCGLD